jgi:hypothetical protein
MAAATGLSKTKTVNMRNLAVQAQQVKDNSGNAVNTATMYTNERRLDSSALSTTTGTVGAAPAAGTLTVVHDRYGPFVQSTFTLTAARMTHTDAGASGSYGTLPLHTFPEGSIRVLGSRVDITAIAINSTCITTTAVGVFALGTAAVAAAADGALTSTSVDIGATTSITLSGGTGAGTTHSAITLAKDGTATAATLNLNESFTAATSSSNGTLDITATITVLWAHMATTKVLQHLDTQTKGSLDAAAGIAVVGTLMNWLPPIAATLGIIWYCFLIWGWLINKNWKAKK